MCVCDFDCLCTFAASPRPFVRVLFWSLEALGLLLWEGRGLRAGATTMPPASASVWPGWAGPPRKHLYLFPRCYFSGPHGFIKSFGGYFGSFGGRFAWLPVGANGHWVIFTQRVRNVDRSPEICDMSSICPNPWPGFILNCSTRRNEKITSFACTLVR